VKKILCVTLASKILKDPKLTHQSKLNSCVLALVGDLFYYDFII
jgi:hypothetical protein